MSGAPFPLELRHGNGTTGIPGVGHGVFFTHARDVRGGAVDGIAEAPGAGARPDGHQATVLLPQRRRPIFRLGTESDPGASGGATESGSGRVGYVPVAELRGGHEDVDPGDPEGGAGTLAGMARREDSQRSVVEAS